MPTISANPLSFR